MTWPTDHGPLATLRQLGLHTSHEPPTWLRNMDVKGSDDPAYVASPAFLNDHAIQQLAALSLAGYQVYAKARGRERITLVIRHEP